MADAVLALANPVVLRPELKHDIWIFVLLNQGGIRKSLYL